MTLKVRHVPCLCPPCIRDDGSECLNAEFTDPWRTVKLIPEKGANLRKYQKRKKPVPKETPIPVDTGCTCDDEESDEDLPDIQMDFDIRKRTRSVAQKSKENATSSKSVADAPSNSAQEINEERHCTWVSVAEEITANDFMSSEHSSQKSQESDDIEIIEVCERGSKEFKLAGENNIRTQSNVVAVDKLAYENIPEDVFWLSILLALENCRRGDALDQLAHELHGRLPPLKPRQRAVYDPVADTIDNVAENEIPLDGPTSLRTIKTIGDGNCLCRALSKAFYNDDTKHLEIRARIVIEGIMHKDSYITDDCLERGASLVHGNADLPTVFSTFSEYYTPGQKLTDDTISCIYTMEIHSCSHPGSYMGLWQLAQASSVLQIPIHTIYPHRPGTLRNDFHRIFFPIEYPPTMDDEPVVIMWTGVRRGGVPVHFVPLLKSPE